MILTGIAIIVLAQSTTQTAPLPNPYSSTNRPAASSSARPIHPRGRIRPILIGQTLHEPHVEPVAPAKPDPLKDLVISPVYERHKITPKMIEIP